MTIITPLDALLDPTGADTRETDATLAPRPESLHGLTVGLLDNTKPNAIFLLEQIGSGLQFRFGAGELKLYHKDYFGTPATPELIELIAAECDVVITAVGDCGSCSAATTADGILLERAGVPTVAICSDAFDMSARAMAEVQGFAGFEYLTIAHPVASLDAAQLSERALEALPAIGRILGSEA